MEIGFVVVIVAIIMILAVLSNTSTTPKHRGRHRSGDSGFTHTGGHWDSSPEIKRNHDAGSCGDSGNSSSDGGCSGGDGGGGGGD